MTSDSLARLPAQHRHGIQGERALMELRVEDSGGRSLFPPRKIGGALMAGCSGHLVLSKLHVLDRMPNVTRKQPHHIQGGW
jgi:hypothetical protein